MITLKTLDIDWIKTVSQKNRKTDPILIEKLLRALILLEGLVKSEQHFVFKGGTALMLLLGSIKRLSIDIDIVVENQIDFSIEKMFDNLLPEFGFSRYELKERKIDSKIIKAHYKFYYTPVHKTSQAEDYILLDILFETSNYNRILPWTIDSKFVIQEGEQLAVNIPTFEDLLGDKLTAFAPNTTGVPYEKNGYNQAMEIIKQLYDIGCLFNVVNNLEIVRNTFYKFAEIEASYRDLQIKPEDVLEDVFYTSLCISTRGNIGKENFEKLKHGIKSISSFVFSEIYHIEKAIIDASKAAYLAKLIQSPKKEIEKFLNPEILSDWIIEFPLDTKLNKLKKSNPEAFFYWYKIFEIERFNLDKLTKW